MRPLRSRLHKGAVAEVFRAIEALRAGRTTLVIAHRLSTVRAANRILVLGNGRIVADGTHHALLGSSEHYRRLTGDFT